MLRRHVNLLEAECVWQRFGKGSQGEKIDHRAVRALSKKENVAKYLQAILSQAGSSVAISGGLGSAAAGHLLHDTMPESMKVVRGGAHDRGVYGRGAVRTQRGTTKKEKMVMKKKKRRRRRRRMGRRTLFSWKSSSSSKKLMQSIQRSRTIVLLIWSRLCAKLMSKNSYWSR